MPAGVTIELTTGDLLLYGIPFIIVIGWVSSRLLGSRSRSAGFYRIGVSYEARGQGECPTRWLALSRV